MNKALKEMPGLDLVVDTILDQLRPCIRASINSAYSLGVTNGLKKADDTLARVKSLLQGDDLVDSDTKGAPVVSEPDEEDDEDPLPEFVDCATLDPLTPIQFEVFKIIKAAAGEYVSGPTLAEKTRNAGAPTATYSLKNKGYLRSRRLGGGRRAWDVICFGEPRVIGKGEHPHSLAHRPLDTPAPATAFKVPESELVDAATLPRPSPREWQLLRVLPLLLRDNPACSVATMASNSGVPSGSIPAVLGALELKGYVRNVGEHGSPRREICFFGAVTSEKQEGVPDDTVFVQKPIENDEVEAVEEPQETAVPPCTPVEPEEEEPDADADEPEVDADDLSKGPREVLCIVYELHTDNVHPIKEPDILQLSEADKSRMAFILNRLRELNLVRRDAVGSYFPTPRGIELAKEIKAEEAAEE